MERGGVVADGEAAIGGLAEDEGRLVPEAPGPSRVVNRHPDDRLDVRRATTERCAQEIVKPRTFARELLRVREMLPVAAAADAEVPAEGGAALRDRYFTSRSSISKTQRRVGRNDAAGAAPSVGHAWRDGEHPRAADFHARDALVPAGDDFAGTEPEVERLVAVAELSNFVPFLSGLPGRTAIRCSARARSCPSAPRRPCLPWCRSFEVC